MIMLLFMLFVLLHNFCHDILSQVFVFYICTYIFTHLFDFHAVSSFYHNFKTLNNSGLLLINNWEKIPQVSKGYWCKTTTSLNSHLLVWLYVSKVLPGPRVSVRIRDQGHCFQVTDERVLKVLLKKTPGPCEIPESAAPGASARFTSWFGLDSTQKTKSEELVKMIPLHHGTGTRSTGKWSSKTRAAVGFFPPLRLFLPFIPLRLCKYLSLQIYFY